MMRMRRVLGPIPALTGLVLALAGGATAQEPGPLPTRLPSTSVKTVDYRLDVTLAEDGRTITGTVEVTWRNDASQPTDELYWHVYNNAFAGRDSVWMREARMLGDNRLPREWGGTSIQSVELVGDTGTSPLEWSWQAPEGTGDRTVLRCALPDAVAPGQSVTARIAFEAKMPPAYRRSGGDGEDPGQYIHAVQWFPKLGVYEEVEGAVQWNCLEYHYLTEYYADYGDWTVVLTLPERYYVDGTLKVGASGTLQEMTENDGTITCTFVAEDIHDFAWTADPDFIVVQREFDPAKWRNNKEEERVARALGRTVEEVRPQSCTMYLMLQPEHSEYEEQYLEATEKALYYYGLWFGSYPYETITCIDPAQNARRTGGMEYPRLFTGGVNKGMADRTLDPEGVTVHEFGHQFWYGLVGNDEFRHAWLDEGFNTYSTQRVMKAGWAPELATYEVLNKQRYGHSVAPFPSFGAGDSRALLTMQRVEIPEYGIVPKVAFEFRRRTAVERWLSEVPAASYMPEVVKDAVWGMRRAHNRGFVEPIINHTYLLYDFGVRGTNSYFRPALTLETMAGLMGEERWTRTLRAYHEDWRYKHPRPDDFLLKVLEHGTGAAFVQDDGNGVLVDWASFWEQGIEGNHVVDFAVSRVVNQRTIADPKALPDEYGDVVGMSTETHDVIVEVRRLGDFRVPVEIRFEWDDQTTETHVWDGEGYWWRFREERSPRKIVKVVVDPERKLLLDRDWLNNTRLATPDKVRAQRLGVRALLWAQQVLHYYGGAG